MAVVDSGELEWGVAGRPLPGEEQSGDNHIVTRTATGWLLGVADGLGHGPEAAVASETFLAVLQQYPDEQPVELIRISHDALKHTRGIAGSIVAINGTSGLFSWLGVGNVEGVILHADRKSSPAEYITQRGGVVGYRLPELQPSFGQMMDGDIIVLATDGIESDFVNVIGHHHPPSLLADYILDHYAKPTDDALVLVAHWHVPSLPQGEIGS